MQPPRNLTVLSVFRTLMQQVTCLVWLAAALTGLALPGAAQVLPEPQSATVNDFSRVLDAATEADLAQRLATLRDETGVQMVVVTMPQLDLYGGRDMRLGDYAKALFNAWGIGEADRNDGILMLVLTEAREVRITLGSGYAAVYDGRAARVLSTAVLPEFREGRLAEGIVAGVISARERLVQPFVEGREVDLDDGFVEDAAPGSNLWLLGAGGFFGWVVYTIRRSRRRRRTCPNCAALTLKRTNEVIDTATLATTGTGMEHLTCASCGFIDRKSYVIPMITTDDPHRQHTSGSGDSGFGGGSSSGGGASDKW